MVLLETAEYWIIGLKLAFYNKMGCFNAIAIAEGKDL